MAVSDPLRCPTQIKGVEIDRFCGNQCGVLNITNNHVARITVKAISGRFRPEWLLRTVVSCDVATYSRTGYQDLPEQGVGVGQLR